MTEYRVCYSFHEYRMHSNYSRTKLSWVLRPWSHPRLFLSAYIWCRVTYNERTCHIVPFFHCCLCSICGSKYDRCFVAYQFIFWLSWCEASNDVDSFLLYGQAARSAQVGNGDCFLCGRHLTSHKGFSESTIPQTP